MKICNKCGVEIPDEPWDYGDAFNKGEIHLSRSCQLFKPYGDFQEDAWRQMKEHPVFTKCDAQWVTLEYGNDNYRLCHNCNDKFIRIVGEFFGLKPDFVVKEEVKHTVVKT